MNRKRTILGVIIGLPILLIGLWIFHTSIYPFTSKDPNFADVESAFSKLQFPADWQEIGNSENKGIAGRGCDTFNASGCFHKSKTFKIPEATTVEDVKRVLESGGCISISVVENTKDSENERSQDLSCTLNESRVNIVGTFEGPENEAYISANTY